MNVKHVLWSLTALLGLTLSACAYDPAQVAREKDREMMDLRRQVEQLKLQVKAKEDDTRKLEGQLMEARKLEAQVTGLQDRLKVMDDMMLSKSEDIARLEAQLSAAREAAAAPKGKMRKRPAPPMAPLTPETSPAPAPAPPDTAPKGTMP